MLVHAAGGSPNNNNVTTSPAVNITGANLIVAVVARTAGFALADITDSAGNNWGTNGVDLLSTGTSGAEFHIIYMNSPTTSASYTMTYTGSGAVYPSVAFIAVDGFTAIDNTAQNSNAVTAATSVQPGSVTPAFTNELIASGVQLNAAFSALGVTGFTRTDTVNVPGTSFGVGMGYIIETSIVAQNPTWSWTGTSDAATLQFAFRGTFSAPTLARREKVIAWPVGIHA